MKRASDLSDKAQRRQVAVVVTEAKTSCKLVPGLATESSRYDRAEDIIGRCCCDHPLADILRIMAETEKRFSGPLPRLGEGINALQDTLILVDESFIVREWPQLE